MMLKRRPFEWYCPYPSTRYNCSCVLQLQRVGRTGRKRAGFVHVLLAEGREEFNLDKANDTYKEVQKTIWRGEKLELYADVERLLPEHIKPQCLEKVMEIQEYVREEGRKKGKSNSENTSPTKTTKRKRNDDVTRNIPTGASTGFVSVADLLVKGTKKRKKVPTPKDFELAGQDDDTDKEIESGLILNLPRRTKSSAASTSKSTRPKLRKSSTIDGAKATKKKKQKKEQAPAEPTSSQFSSKGIDDEDDMDIEQGMILTRPVRMSTPRRSVSPELPHLSSSTSSAGAVVDFSTSHSNDSGQTGWFRSSEILRPQLIIPQVMSTRCLRLQQKAQIRVWHGLSMRMTTLILSFSPRPPSQAIN